MKKTQVKRRNLVLSIKRGEERTADCRLPTAAVFEWKTLCTALPSAKSYQNKLFRVKLRENQVFSLLRWGGRWDKTAVPSTIMKMPYKLSDYNKQAINNDKRSAVFFVIETIHFHISFRIDFAEMYFTGVMNFPNSYQLISINLQCNCWLKLCATAKKRNPKPPSQFKRKRSKFGNVLLLSTEWPNSIKCAALHWVGQWHHLLRHQGDGGTDWMAGGTPIPRLQSIER